MGYLQLRRVIELSVLDHPVLARLFRPHGGGRSRGAPAESWDRLHATGVYENLLDSDKRHHHRLLAALLMERNPGGRVLEVGCGQGAFYESLRALRPQRYLGTDISAEAIEQAKTRFLVEIDMGQAEFGVADGSSLALQERFDAIVFADCIEYLGPVDEVLRRYAPLLSPQGVFGFSQWLALHPLTIWREMKSLVEVLDELVVSTPWGGAWQVWTCRPRADGGEAGQSPDG